MTDAEIKALLALTLDAVGIALAIFARDLHGRVEPGTLTADQAFRLNAGLAAMANVHLAFGRLARELAPSVPPAQSQA